jgi:hypothetical protein
MVVVKNYSGSQIDELPSMTGRVVYDSTLNTLRFHNSTNYSNILAVKDTSNNMNGVNNLRTTGNVGVNTTAADRQVEINSATGDCLRLTYNDSNGSATNYTDLLISSGGDLSITPSGGNVNISSHNGSTTGLKLGGTLVTSTAAELNYVDVTAGTAVASKALVVDSSRDITNINALTATTLTGASMVLSSPETGTLDTNAFDTMTQFSGTTPAFAYDSYNDLAFNSNRSYYNSSGSNIGSVSSGTVLTTYQSANGFNGSSISNQNALVSLNNGNILFTTRFNTAGGQYAAGLLVGTRTALTSVLWSGELQGTGSASITGIAAKDINNIVFITNNSKMFYTTDGTNFTENTNKPSGIGYDPTSGSTVIWASGFNKFLVGLTSGAGVAYSSDGITWTSATTPSSADRSWVYYNPILNKAFAYSAGTNTLIVTNDGVTWTSATLPTLTGTTFGEFLNNTHTGLVAIYPNPGSSTDNLIYSTDGVTWTTKLITSTSSIPGNSWIMSKSNICVFSDNVAFWSILNSSWKVAITAQLISAVNIFKLNYLSGYLANQSKTGYQWYTSSTDDSPGTKIMEIDNQLDISVPQALTNTTDATSSTVGGALTIAGGAAVAKKLFVGTDLSIVGTSTLSGVVGVGTTAPDKKLEINSATGDCLRLTYNDADGSATNYTDLLITSGGDLTITPSGGDVNISSHNGSTTGLKLGDVLVTSTAAELNYVDVTAGAGTASKALVLDGDKAISGITTLGATTINVTNLNITGSSGVDTLNTTGNVGIKTSALDYGLEINDAAGDVLRLSYNDANGGPSDNRVDFQVSSTGTLTITPVGTTPSVNIAGHNGSTQGLQLGGTLVTSTAAELNYVDVTPGTATASKALVLDANLDIATINSLTATSITGTLQTAAQTNITTVGTLAGLVATGVVNVSSHDGSTTGLQLGGTLVTSTAAELNYVDVTAGTAAASKALVLDSSRDITNINSLTASTLTGTLQTAAQTNITSVGTLAGLVATGVVNVSSHDGSTTGLQLGGTLVTATAAELNLLDGVTSTAAELNYVDTTAGTVVASKAMVVDSSRNIVNLNNLRTTGNLGINSSAPDKQVEINSATGDCLRLTYNDADGTAATYLDNTISSAGVFTMTAAGSSPGIVLSNSTNVSSTLNVTGAVGVGTTAPDKKLEVNSSTGDCLRLTYNDADGTATNYTDLLITSGGNLTITPSGGDVNISSHNGSTTGLKLNGTLVTSTAAELNYVDVTPGTAVANKALVVDTNKDIVDINYFEAKEIVSMKPGSGNNNIDYPLSITTLPANANSAAIGLGTGIEFNSVNDADAVYNAGSISFVSSDITEDAESGFFDFKLANGGTIDTIFTVSNNGVASATSYVETSDIRAKENIQETISVDSLAKILQVHVKTYNYKKDLNKRSCIGVIAQELKEIVPESVVISKTDDFDDFHQVQYTSLIPHLINCIKVLHEELEELKSKL